MRIYAKIAAIAAIGMSMASCAFSGSSDSGSEVEYFAFKESSKGDWGFIKPDGTVLYADEFKNVPTAVVDGVFFVEEGDGISLYTAAGKQPAIVGGLEDLASAGGFSQGLAPIVRKGERIEIINTSGKTRFVLDPIKGKEVAACMLGFNDGMLVITTEDGKMGAYNASGQLVVAAKYDRLSPYNDGYALARVDDGDVSTYSVIDKKGEVVFKCKESWGVNTYNAPFRDGWMAVTIDDRCALVDIKGEAKKLPSKVEDIVVYNKDYVVYSNDGSKGLMRISDCEVMIRAKYDNMSFIPWDSKHVLVHDDDEYFVLDFNGEKTIDFKDDYGFVVAVRSKGFAGFIAGEENDIEFLDTKGKRVKPKQKVDICDISASAYQDFRVRSDYFDLAGFCSKLLGMIGSDGFDGIKVDGYANKYYPTAITSDPSRGSYTCRFEPTGHDAEGYRYTIKPKITTARSISSWQYLGDNGPYYSGDWAYVINENNPIENIIVEATGPDGLWAQCKDKIMAGMEAKGFTLVDDDGDEVSYSGTSCNVVFSSRNYGIIVSLRPLSAAVEAEAE